MPVEMLDIAANVVLQSAETADPVGGSIDDVVNALDDAAIWFGAAAGGAFGAALGALPAFVITGFLVVAGEVGMGFGPVFGPHISFAGGAAAAAYAAKKGYIDSVGGYHNGKDIATALGNKPDVLAVGAGFGLFGIAVEQLFRNMMVPVDPIPVSIVASAFVHRAVFGYSIIGEVRGKGYLDMSPFERDEKVGDGADVATDGGSVENGGQPKSEWLATEPWLPHQYKWAEVAGIGLFTGLAAAYVTHATGNMFLPFGVSAASLLFLNLGVEKIPVTHHMTLAGSTVYAAFHPAGIGISVLDNVVGSSEAILIAGIFGLFAAVMGEVTQRIFYAHGRTHIDPPAMAIVIWTVLLGILYIAGVVPHGGWIPGTTLVG